MTESIVISGGTIIDGRGGAPIKDGVIVIDGKRITSVGAVSTPVPPYATKIDATGKFLTPGLMNSSIYLFCDRPPIATIRYEGRYDELIIEAAQLALKGGVTTVFDAWGPREYLIKARDDINEGRQTGARIYCSGAIIGTGGPVSDDFYPDARAALFEYGNKLNAMWEQGVGRDLMSQSLDEARAAVRRYAESGVNFLKYAVTSINPEKPPYIVFSPRFQRMIVDEGHRAGIPVRSFSVSVEGIHLAADAGADILGHADVTGPSQGLLPETVDLLVRHRTPTPILATPEESFVWLKKFAPWYENIERNHRALLRAGAKVLLATDGGILSSNTKTNPVLTEVPYDRLLDDPTRGHFNWLLAAEEKGLNAMDSLIAATRDIARAYQIDSDLGTLEAGKIADLLILDKNPLDRAENYRSISQVIKEGRVVDRSALPTKRLLSESD